MSGATWLSIACTACGASLCVAAVVIVVGRIVATVRGRRADRD